MIQDVIWSLNAVGYLGILLIAGGLILWFIVRRQKQRLWLPVLRVIKLDLTVLPKFRWIHPPLWPLLCFFLACLALGIYLFEPTEPVIKGDNLDLRPTHVFFDLSPSLALTFSAAQYGEEGQRLLDQLRDKAKLTFSFSTGPEIFTAADSHDVSKKINALGFHRAGLKLGAAVDRLLQKAPDIEHLVIVSDRDQGTWEDFNWRYLEKKMQISWLSAGMGGALPDNVFIDELKPRDQSGFQKNLAWTVLMRRTGQGKALRGQLKAELEGRQLAAHDWQFGPDGKSLEVDIALPQEILLQQTQDKLLVLNWEISASGPGDLLIDNTFRSWLQVQNQKALLISRPRGEMFLDDSVFHLKTSLEVLGFRTQRVDQWSPQPALGMPPTLLLTEVTPESTMRSFCPIEAVSRRANSTPQHDLQAWILPSADLLDFGEICYCFASLLQAPQVILERPAYCDKLEHRDQYVGVLQSLGAVQLGGSVDSPLGALGMTFRNAATKTKILAFTVPLNPMQKGGISFGQLPLMIQSVWKFLSGESTVPAFGSGAVWPRIEDISTSLASDDPATSNVPLAESLLRQMATDQLPPQLSVSSQGIIRQSSLASRERDARPWIYLCLSLVVLAIWLEALGYGFARMFQKQSWVARWFGLIIFISYLSHPDSAEGQVRMNALGYAPLPQLTSIRREVAARTSIDFLESAQQFNSIQRETLLDPWLWVAQPQILENLDRSHWSEVMAWLQRGGFLIVENHGGAQRLKQQILEQNPQGVWKPIPPDHELMRSFHLLASLPQCGQFVWEGFHFDQRIAVVLVPGDFMRMLLDERNPPACFSKFSHEQAVRVFINLLMVALATDYKKDQIHLPEILKRLR